MWDLLSSLRLSQHSSPFPTYSAKPAGQCKITAGIFHQNDIELRGQPGENELNDRRAVCSFPGPACGVKLNLIRTCVHCSAAPVMSSSVTLQAVPCQAPQSVSFSKQEHWSGLPFSPPGDLPSPGIEPRSPALLADSLALSHWGSLIRA